MTVRPTAALILFPLALMGVACAADPASRGRRLYAERGCAVCHGAAGHGDGPSARRLDVPPRDFANRAAYRYGANPTELAASMRNGVGAMPPFRDLTEAEAQDIGAWIASLQPSSTARQRP
jgi:mono/diheme cytochrome c family protein